MKTNTHKFLTIFFIATIFTSCGVDMFNRIEGNRNVIVKKRKPQENFNSVKVSGGLELYLSEENTSSITIEADENLHKNIITEVENGVLKIYPKKYIHRAKAKKIFVTANYFNSISATSGSYVVSENTLNSKEISFATTSGATIRVKVNSESIATNTTSGSSIKISGNTKNHASNATSGSSIEAFKLKSANVIAKATSGASINVYASQKIEGRATSGAGIDFKGNPQSVDKSSSSGGSVSSY